MQSRGEKLERSGKEYKWVTYDASGKHDSISIYGNRWFNQREQSGGYPIMFLKKYFNLSFQEAMGLLLNGECGENLVTADREYQVKEKKPLQIPPKNHTMKRVFAYLMKQRCIDADVIEHFAKAETIYEDEKHHNIIFVGLDENGVAKHINKKSTNSEGYSFRGIQVGSDGMYSFCHTGENEKVFAFESPIDMLSFITMNKQGWLQSSYISLNGVGDKALMHFLSLHKNIKSVTLCLDNDDAGRSATARITSKLKVQGYQSDILVPDFKDFNEDLKELCNSSVGNKFIMSYGIMFVFVFIEFIIGFIK